MIVGYLRNHEKNSLLLLTIGKFSKIILFMAKNPNNFHLDAADKRILTVLQSDSQISMAALSERIGLSLSACHRRVKILESEGIIRRYSAQLDRRTLGLELEVFIEVKLTNQRSDEIEAFEQAIRTMPEILECHMISGEFDFLMRVAARGAADYEKLYRTRLAAIPSIAQMKTLLSLSAVKTFSGYHIQ